MSNPEARFNQAIKEILAGGLTRTVLSVILGFLVGAMFMIGSNKLITSVFTIEIKNHKLAVGSDTIELIGEKHCEQRWFG